MNNAETARVHELGPGVWQFVGARRSAHSYLFKGRRRIALVDSGLPTTTGYLEACLATLGLAPRDLDWLVLTHEHIDHAGGAAFFARQCLVAAHAQAANKLALADDFSLMTKAFAEAARPFQADLCCAEGTAIELGGLTPTSRGVRVKYSGSKCTVIDGPFPESKELIAGYLLLEVKTLAEAIEWAKRAPFGLGVLDGEEPEVELRPLFDPTDFDVPGEAEERAKRRGEKLGKA